MKESDYINVTTLAKLRIASTVLRDTFPKDDAGEKLRAALVLVEELIEEYEKRVLR